MADESNLDEMRATAESILARAREDETFLAALRADPLTVLQDAGLPEERAASLAYGEFTLAEGEVTGFMRWGSGYCLTTNDGWCIISVCGYFPVTY